MSTCLTQNERLRASAKLFKRFFLLIISVPTSYTFRVLLVSYSEHKTKL